MLVDITTENSFVDPQRQHVSDFWPMVVTTLFSR